MVDIEFTVKQSLAWEYLEDSTTEEILYGGAAGSGKSYLGCIWLLINCIRYPGSRWVMGRKELKRLKETTLATFFEVSNKFGFSKQFDYNAVDGAIKFKNGSLILLKDLAYQPSDPNFDSLGSLEITGAFVDEIAEISSKAIEVLISRCRYKLKQFGICKKIFMSCNPSKNWSYTTFYLADKEGKLEDYRKFIQALPTDNPYIDPSYITSLQRLSPALRARLLYGQWEYGEEDVLFEPEWFGNMFSTTIPTTHNKKYITVDVARTGKDNTVICLWYDLTMVKMIHYNGLLLDESANIIRELATKENVATKDIIIDSTGIGAGLVDMLKCTEFISANKSEGYQNIKTHCYFKFSEKVKNNEVKLNIPDSDVQATLMQELECIKVLDKVDNKLSITSKDEIKKLIGRSPDYADALMMRMLPEVKPKSKFYIGGVKYN